MDNRKIILKKVRTHNLKDISLSLNANELVVFTGVSGSGKSSMAFDTLYVEGQRRYIESLSHYARRQMSDMSKPDLESAEGISPTISIEQKTAGKNPRSTVGTMTEIYDYLRVLYARVGTPHCPVSGEAVMPQSRERIIKTVQSYPSGSKVVILAPYARNKKAEFKEDFVELMRKGYMRVRIDGAITTLGEEIALDGNVAHDVDIVVDRLVIDESSRSRTAEAITTALSLGNGLCSVVDSVGNNEELFSMHAFSPKSGLSYGPLEPQHFSFNSPVGMCERCSGIGVINEFDLSLVIDEDKSIAQDCCSVASSYKTVRYGNIYDNLSRLYHFDIDTPWKELSDGAKRVFLYGTEKKWTRMHFVHPITGAHWSDHVQWRGVLREAHNRYAEAKSDSYKAKMSKLMQQQECPECRGCRLKAYPAAALLHDKRISDITAMTVKEAIAFFNTLPLTPSEAIIADELLKEIRERLSFLREVGLHYLKLERTAPTLSGGESQRVRLASQIGCGLVGITYILDEPSIGLHPRDNDRLIATLHHLRDMGNSVVVVEHDEETILSADRIIDFGPGPGVRGGTIVSDGDLKALVEAPESLTGDYLIGRREIAIPKKRRKKGKTALKIVAAEHNNLKKIDVNIPLGLFVAITGVSGSGKSSLIVDILYPFLANKLHRADLPVGQVKDIKGTDVIDKVIAIDQSPIGRNPRSNPATYIKLFDDIRELFTQLPESKARGYKVGRFSFNVKEGSCPACGGMGMIRVDMDFMEDAWVECRHCQNKRFDSETLSIYYKGKNIYDILEMEVGEALEFFHNIPQIRHKLKMLQDVGLEYIKLGQSSTTLSGGEAQRVKLAKELVRPATGQTLYILDEPTTGLHFHDINHLLKVLHALVDRGNSVLVIEHNMDVVKTADWIVDLGPEGGDDGGGLVASAPPEKITKMDTPTGHAVGKALQGVMRRQVEELVAIGKGSEGKKSSDAWIKEISVSDAQQNNLKHLDVAIEREKMTVCTGPSGSGKSSLAFDTIYAEGQRRYIESLSPYARQFVKQMAKPKVGRVEGLSPAIAIEQKASAGNPRSTVGTMTEIYDYLRILYARIGIAHSPETGEEIKSISPQFVVEKILSYPEGERIQLLAPLELKKSDEFADLASRLQKQGFVRIRLNGIAYDLDRDKGGIPYDKKRKNELMLVVDRIKVSKASEHRIAEAVAISAQWGQNKIVVARERALFTSTGKISGCREGSDAAISDEGIVVTIAEEESAADGSLAGDRKLTEEGNKAHGDILFNLAFAVESSGESFPEITPQSFAFNTAEGMCPDCFGLGYQYGANLTHMGDLIRLSVSDLMKLLWDDKASDEGKEMLSAFFEAEKIDADVPIYKLAADKLQLFLQGSTQERWYPGKKGFTFRWKGINHVLAKAGKSAYGGIRNIIVPMLDEVECLSCRGSRLKALARHVTVDGQSISDLCRMPLVCALTFIRNIELKGADKKLLEDVIKQLSARLTFLCEVGLHYMTLERRAPTLSGGEAQRIRLARQLGSGLTGVLYVLDEPTIGLHPRDSDRLNRALQQLKKLGNTLLMVEHDPMTILQADYILDFGPTGGNGGGHIMAHGTPKQLMENAGSLTGAYLSGKEAIAIPKKRRKAKKGQLKISRATVHNLKNVDVTISCGLFVCLTGVSGSGKSTLMSDIILPAAQRAIGIDDAVALEGAKVSGFKQFDKVISIDQNPIGHTVRSDVGTYVDVLARMREFFACLPKARAKGLEGRHFSYNHRRGMCSSCWGLGYRKVEMHFLPPVKIVCEECGGLRLNPVSLEVIYGGKNFGQWLDTTVDEAHTTFATHPSIRRILDTLREVGLGYLKLGQEMATLSGGEAQRIKLSRELAKRSTGKTLYLLDEPTTGLHSDDIKKLLSVMHKLVDKGNTMLVIEHNLDLIANADWIIDLGPDAGNAGGQVVASGTPEQVASNPASSTGYFLKRIKGI